MGERVLVKVRQSQAVSEFRDYGARLCPKDQSQRCGWSATQPRSCQIRTLRRVREHFLSAGV